MNHNLLILGGSTEASALAKALADAEISATLSYAGRVSNPRSQPIPHRVGGFGGTAGLEAFLRDNDITFVVDATHPFAAQMSHHAVAACRKAKVPLLALTRPPWQPQPGDDWRSTADITGAVEALHGPACRVMLAIGRLHLASFSDQPQHHYLLRLVDPPATPLPLPNHTVVVSRGPFTLAGDTALMRELRIEKVVTKNSGGSAAVAKLHAARELGIPVVMIERPALPARRQVDSVAEVFHWLDHAGVDLGV
jgi:precorrin-6A/cobalt-precorrin-6A reductase